MLDFDFAPGLEGHLFPTYFPKSATRAEILTWRKNSEEDLRGLFPEESLLNIGKLNFGLKEDLKWQWTLNDVTGKTCREAELYYFLYKKVEMCQYLDLLPVCRFDFSNKDVKKLIWYCV